MKRAWISLGGVVLLSAWLPAVAWGQRPDKAARVEPVDEAQRWALLVGVNAYSELRALRYCVSDMEALQDKLVDGGFRRRNVFLLTDAAPELKYKPTRNNILRQLEVLVQILRPSDTLVVAFSGHGVQLGKTSYFCPLDANLGRPADTLVPLDKVYEMLDSCEAQVKLLLVDACRNDPFRQGDKGAEDAVKAAGGVRGFTPEGERLPKGIALLSSCKKDQQSWEDEKLRHGVFMHFVVKGLEGAAAGNAEGRVGIIDLFRYAEAETRAHVFREHSAPQVPCLKGDVDGNPVIAVALRPVAPVERTSFVTPVPEPKPEPKPAPEPSPTAADSPAVRELLRMGNNFYATREYDKAVQAYSNAINMDPRNTALYVKRGAAHRGKGDIKTAIIDFQTAGQSLTLSITAPSEPLRDSDQTIGTVKQGQAVSITKLQRFGQIDWLWVTSVDGNDAARGWVKLSAVEPQPVKPAPQPAASGYNYNYGYGDGGWGGWDYDDGDY